MFLFLGKTEEENKMKERCDCLVKQVIHNQEVRSMKSLQLLAELPMNKYNIYYVVFYL